MPLADDDDDDDCDCDDDVVVLGLPSRHMQAAPTCGLWSAVK